MENILSRDCSSRCRDARDSSSIRRRRSRVRAACGGPAAGTGPGSSLPFSLGGRRHRGTDTAGAPAPPPPAGAATRSAALPEMPPRRSRERQWGERLGWAGGVVLASWGACRANMKGLGAPCILPVSLLFFVPRILMVRIPLNETKGALLHSQAKYFKEKRPLFPFSLAAGKAEVRQTGRGYRSSWWGSVMVWG